MDSDYKYEILKVLKDIRRGINILVSTEKDRLLDKLGEVRGKRNV